MSNTDRNVSNWRLSGVEAEVAARHEDLARRGHPQPAFDVEGCTDQELRNELDRCALLSRSLRPALRR